MAGGLTPRLVRVALSLCGTAGSERVGALLGEHGELGASRLIANGALAPGMAARFAAAAQGAAHALDAASRQGFRFLVPGDAEWPAQLDDLDLSAPTGLWCRGAGRLAVEAERCIAVVGARSATSYGERIASDIAARAVHTGCAVVSGGAYGIDAAAHRGALAGGGVTIAVMAGGVDVPYPSAHAGLLDRVCDAGIVVSEAAPGAGVRKHAFLTRNRLIAALAADTVVVEAALRSGALNTATWAESLGRVVWGVPGPITSPASAGVNRGIATGSMRALAQVGDVVAGREPGPVLASPVSEQVEGVAGAIVDAVRAGARSLDAVCIATSLQVADALPVLTLLEIEGRIGRDDTGYTVRRAVGA